MAPGMCFGPRFWSGPTHHRADLGHYLICSCAAPQPMRREALSDDVNAAFVASTTTALDPEELRGREEPPLVHRLPAGAAARSAMGSSLCTSVHRHLFPLNKCPYLVWSFLASRGAMWFRVSRFRTSGTGRCRGVFSVVVVLLLCYHLYLLVSINCTTWEFMSVPDHKYLKNCGEENRSTRRLLQPGISSASTE
ncbi:palmitoyltransferase ZDHHC12-B-like protein [Lates japonicus]|uniref:Palmitoyltransferase ZDHHC12-B-like protein n=1 Tax=Lates japonicus TaxID=270547 RepID=A0AAD3MWX9_LATJO|nr:palmitoyltransferase ZDHHC12-B-like protein [Lates japonicus]